MVTNEQIARILYEIADYLEVTQPSRKATAGAAFRPRAYREAAKFVEHYPEELTDVYKRGGERALVDLPEIGPSMAKKIGELIDTGKLEYLEKLRKRFSSLKVKARDKRRPLAEVLPIAKKIVAALKKVPEVTQVEVAGSLRRKTKTVGDIDLVAASRQPEKVMEAFTNLPEVERVYSKGDTKTLVRLKGGIDADLRVVPPESFGAAMQYFTGPKEHSIATRQYARDRGMKLNEYGLFKGKKKLAGRTEKEVYKALGLKYETSEERSTKLVEERD